VRAATNDDDAVEFTELVVKAVKKATSWRRGKTMAGPIAEAGAAKTKITRALPEYEAVNARAAKQGVATRQRLHTESVEAGVKTLYASGLLTELEANCTEAMRGGPYEVFIHETLLRSVTALTQSYDRAAALVYALIRNGLLPITLPKGSIEGMPDMDFIVPRRKDYPEGDAGTRAFKVDAFLFVERKVRARDDGSPGLVGHYSELSKSVLRAVSPFRIAPLLEKGALNMSFKRASEVRTAEAIAAKGKGKRGRKAGVAQPSSGIAGKSGDLVRAFAKALKAELGDEGAAVFVRKWKALFFGEGDAEEWAAAWQS
jgi:hypothetical protein